MPLPTENASLLHLHGPDLAQIAANIAAAPAPLDDVVRTLRAHALAAAESFSELLCLPTLREVETLPYQAGAEERLFQIADSGALRPETKSSKRGCQSTGRWGARGNFLRPSYSDGDQVRIHKAFKKLTCGVDGT